MCNIDIAIFDDDAATVLQYFLIWHMKVGTYRKKGIAIGTLPILCDAASFAPLNYQIDPYSQYRNADNLQLVCTR